MLLPVDTRETELQEVFAKREAAHKEQVRSCKVPIFSFHILFMFSYAILLFYPVLFCSIFISSLIFSHFIP